MTSIRDIRQPAPSSVWRAMRSIWRWTEDVFGGVVAFFIAIAVLVTFVIIALEDPFDGSLDAYLRYVPVLLAFGFEFMHAFCLFTCVRRKPYAVHVALAMPRMPLLLRPLPAAFWAMHLVGALGFVWMAHMIPSGSSWLARGALFALGGLCGFWAFGYLLLAVGSIKRDRGLLEKIWRHRAWYLIVITAAAIALPYTGLARHVRVDLFLLANRMAVPPGSESGTIRLRLRSVGAEPAKVLADPSWDDFEIEVRTPCGGAFKREALAVRRSLRRTAKDYRVVWPRATLAFCELEFRTGETFGAAADWERVEGSESCPPPFAARGTYHLTLSYEDRAGAGNGAVSMLAPVICTIVVE